MSTSESVYESKPWLRYYDYWAPAQANFPHQPLYHILQLATGLFGDRPATAFLGAQLSYRELRSQVDRLAKALHEMGIQKCAPGAVGLRAPWLDQRSLFRAHRFAGEGPARCRSARVDTRHEWYCYGASLSAGPSGEPHGRAAH